MGKKKKDLKTLFNQNCNIMTGAWLLTNDSKQISDCIGGRKGDAVRYCQSEQILKIQFYDENISNWC